MPRLAESALSRGKFAHGCGRDRRQPSDSGKPEQVGALSRLSLLARSLARTAVSPLTARSRRIASCRVASRRVGPRRVVSRRVASRRVASRRADGPMIGHGARDHVRRA
jgi:hypothetical protein